MMRLVDVEESCYSLLCKFQILDDNLTWIFMGAYGATSKGERELLLWKDLGATRGLWGEP